MSTFLFNETIFGPVRSRRFGVSLGINLLPCNRKVCSFNCIYCECGWTPDGSHAAGDGLADPEKAMLELESRLIQMANEHDLPNSITFAGNGEPTLHPHFLAIMKKTVALRDQYAPMARVTVLSNATTVNRPDVFEALLLADNHVMKLDAGTEKTYKQINQAASSYVFPTILSNLLLFNGDLTIQTLFLRGRKDNELIDNTTDEEVEAWLGHLKQIKPNLVMIYPIARDTPADKLEVIPHKKLEEIAQKVTSAGFNVEIF